MARMTRDDWLLLGLSALSAEGPGALALEALTHRAQRTRGSFYHHFSDQKAFIEALAALWQMRRIADMQAAVAAAGGAAGGASLSTIVGHLDQGLEEGMRRLAETAPAARAAVRAVDDARIACLAGLGPYPGTDAAADYALVEYAVFRGLRSLRPDMTGKEAERLRLLLSDMVVAHWNE